MKYKLLDKINSPDDLRRMSDKKMPELASEIRRFLVANVTETGGHLASNLGVVELTLALHRVFNSPADHIIFDVGHQSYVHKLITGRKELFDTLRNGNGLSGFTNRSESKHDPFGAGHSSTALSAAIGFAEADRIAGRKNYTVAVIGDGAYTGGMVHEALNNLERNLRLIIILNENEMSISRNIGSFAKYIAKIRSSERYFKTKKVTGTIINKIPLIGENLFNSVRDLKQSLKDRMYGSNYFENLGLYYLGPIDGNNMDKLETLLTEAKAVNQSTIIHIKTKKGKGYPPAEANPAAFHNVSPAGTVRTDNSFSKEFGRLLSLAADEKHDICAVTAAMTDGTGLGAFKNAHPERFFDVGIAEEHALTFSAGLAAGGMRPFFAVYSSFLQRGYDNIIHDIALQRLPVVICVDRTGLNLHDGATHHGIFDVAFLSHIPNMEIYAPFSYNSLRLALEQAYKRAVPSAIRYSNCAESTELVEKFKGGTVKCDFTDREENDCIIITYGKITSEAVRAKELLALSGKRCGVILLEKLKPYRETAVAVAELLPVKDCKIVFLEEGIQNGGAAMLLWQELSGFKITANKKYIIKAISDNFAERTGGKNYYAACSISAEDVVDLLF